MRTLLLFQLCIISCACYNILLFHPKFAYSHLNFFSNIVNILVDAGHNVTWLQPIVWPSLPNIPNKARMIYIEADPEIVEIVENPKSDDFVLMWTTSTSNPLAAIAHAPICINIFSKTMAKVWKEKEIFEQLKNEHFDVGIVELFDMMGLPVMEHLGIRNVIGANSMGLNEATALAIGVPLVPSYVPASLTATTDKTTLLNRAFNMLYTYLTNLSYEYFLDSVQRETDIAFGADAPNARELLSEVSLVITNSEPLLDFARPTLHKIIDIGGIGVKKAKKLDEEYDRILSLRPKTVLISFGSVTHSVTMPLEMRVAFVNTLAKFSNVTFIWKYEDPEATIVDHLPNVLLRKWIPQVDLVADPRLSAFITHCGYGSLLESASYATPIIAVPIFGDQMRNAKIAEKHGFGIDFNKLDLANEYKIEEALNSILYEQSYTQNAAYVSRLLAARPFDPKDKLIRSVELTAQFGHLKAFEPAGKRLSYVKYYNFDLFVVSFVTLIVFMYGSYRLVRYLLTAMLGNWAVKIKQA